MRTRLVLLAGLGAAGVTTAVAVSASAADPTVAFKCCAYAPPTTTIDAGQSVTFSPAAGEDFEGADADSHPLKFVDPSIPGQTTGSAAVTRTFTTPGTYVYYCTVHGTPDEGMRGTVVVRTPAPAAPSPAPTAPAPPAPVSAPKLTRVVAGAAARVRLATVRASGIKVGLTVDAPAELAVSVKAGRTTLATARSRVAAAGRTVLRVRLPAAALRRLARRPTKLTLTARARARDGTLVRATRSVTVTR